MQTLRFRTYFEGNKSFQNVKVLLLGKGVNTDIQVLHLYIQE